MIMVAFDSRGQDPSLPPKEASVALGETAAPSVGVTEVDPLGIERVRALSADQEEKAQRILQELVALPAWSDVPASEELLSDSRSRGARSHASEST